MGCKSLKLALRNSTLHSANRLCSSLFDFILIYITLCFVSDTMMKFASFETVVEMIYKNVIPVPKEKCSKNKQLGVSFAAGYIAGVLCAVVSHPADNLVSFLNNAKGATIGDVSP